MYGNETVLILYKHFYSCWNLWPWLWTIWNEGLFGEWPYVPVKQFKSCIRVN